MFSTYVPLLRLKVMTSTSVQDKQQHSVSMSQLAQKQQEGSDNTKRTSQSDYNVASGAFARVSQAGSVPRSTGSKEGALSAGSTTKTASLPAGSGFRSGTFPVLPSGSQTESLPVLPMPPGKKRHNSMRTIMNGKGQSILDIFAEDDAEENETSKFVDKISSETDKETATPRDGAGPRPV
ncbi:hypothetical protein FHG87_008691 [Trinorchestia longiramus]|nr:hypothetical protein FHG87_008691 [Trinorchestia longiramus]